MNILIVHAHHEPNSFCSALKDAAVSELTTLGHQVVVSDLYAEGFDPISDRRNFTTVADGNYLKQQAEEAYAQEMTDLPRIFAANNNDFRNAMSLFLVSPCGGLACLLF